MEAQTISKLIPATVLLLLGAAEAFGGLYLDDKRTRNDFTIELLSLVILPTLIQPAIFLAVLLGMGTFFASYEDIFIATHLGWHVLAFLVLDDMTQYWWHRFSHSNRKMWKLHRPHHVVEEMGCLLYTSPSPRDKRQSRMPSSA